jgi:hypothetical protein
VADIDSVVVKKAEEHSEGSEDEADDSLMFDNEGESFD